MSTARSTRVGGLHVEVHSPATGLTKGVVVMVHGACTSSRLWTRWAERLATRGLEVWCPDLRGHGQSDGREQLGKTGLDDFAHDVSAVLEASGGQALVGHDMGGLIVQLVASRTPLRGAVLVDTVAPRGIGAAGSVLDIWRQVFRPRILRAILRGATWTYSRDDVAALSSGKMSAEECAEVAAWLGPESGLATREMTLAGIAVDERKVLCPTLVVATTFDGLTPPARQRLVASRYRADYVEFAQHAHYPMLEPGWERPIAVIGRWLEEAARLNGDNRGSVSRLTAARRSATGTPIPGASLSPLPGASLSPLPGASLSPLPGSPSLSPLPGSASTPPPTPATVPLPAGRPPTVPPHTAAPATAAPATAASPLQATGPYAAGPHVPDLTAPSSVTDTPLPGMPLPGLSPAAKASDPEPSSG